MAGIDDILPSAKDNLRKAAEMEALESAILAGLGVPDPYAVAEAVRG